MKLKVNQKLRIKGHFDIYLTRGDTGKKELVSSFDNLILDQGMDWMGTNGGFLTYCHVGTGNSTPTTSQTTLDAKIATKSYTSGSNSTPAAPNYEIKSTITYAFAQGAVVGNISEVGVGLNTTQLFCRALTTDSSGNPTTITATSIDYLTVVYTLTAFPQITDSTQTITVNGVSTTVTTRAISVTSNISLYQYGVGNYPLFPSGTGINSSALSNGMQTVTTGAGVGKISNASSESTLSYTSGTYKVTRRCTFNNGAGNGTITRFELWTSLAYLQMGVSPSIVKDNTMTLVIDLFVTWSRA